MKELTIYEFQAEEIQNALRLVANLLESHKKETCLDRNVMQAKQMIENVLAGKIDTHVSRF